MRVCVRPSTTQKRRSTVRFISCFPRGTQQGARMGTVKRGIQSSWVGWEGDCSAQARAKPSPGMAEPPVAPLPMQHSPAAVIPRTVYGAAAKAVANNDATTATRMDGWRKGEEELGVWNSALSLGDGPRNRHTTRNYETPIPTYSHALSPFLPPARSPTSLARAGSRHVCTLGHAAPRPG